MKSICNHANFFSIKKLCNRTDFYLSTKQDAQAAKRFLKKALASCHATKPRIISADGDKAYPVAIRELKED
ncbi:DDE-type integrase/transposase/recombinase, partial [Bacillus thuringiensis]|uniref:DDE-type integrase/transposase/recombinase n=1 Tax=Bacillus thuringiensis TaxID=1428 RepID=UPI002AB3748F